MTTDRPAQPPDRILLIKPSSLGDVVTAMPVLRGLRRSFPAAHIAWLIGTAYAPLVDSDSDLNEVILFDRARFGPPWHWPLAGGELVRLVRRLRAGRFDWAIDLQGLLRSGLLAAASGAAVRAGFADAREGASVCYNVRVLPAAAHTVDRNIELARHLGVDARSEDMTLQVTPEGHAYAQSLISRCKLPPKGFLVCMPPTRWATKRYPVRHWRKVVAALARQSDVVVMGGGGREKQLCDAVAEGLDGHVVNLAGQTSVPEMVAVLAVAAAAVCCDSSAKFIAPAVGTDVVALLGPTRPTQTGPYLRGRAIVADVPCQGCLKKRCPHVTCMEVISPDQVVAAAMEMLDKCA